jgi:hypothetical protein
MIDSNSLGIAYVDFQGIVDKKGNFPEGLSSLCVTECFPASPPPSLRRTENYQGIKLFSYKQEYVCVSKFFDNQQTDTFGRAIPSAHVIVFPTIIFKRYRHCISSICKILETFNFEHFAISEEIFGSIDDQLNDLPELNNREVVTEIVSRNNIPIDNIFNLVLTLIENPALLICGISPEKVIHFLDALFMLLPIKFVIERSWSTYCYNPEGNHEEVVFANCLIPERAKKGVLGKMKGRFARGTERVSARANPMTGNAFTKRIDPSQLRFKKNLLKYLFSPKDLDQVPFSERYLIVIDLVARRIPEDAFALEQLLPTSFTGEVKLKIVNQVLEDSY